MQMVQEEAAIDVVANSTTPEATNDAEDADETQQVKAAERAFS